MSDYPEHDKLKALNGDNEKIGVFLEWLRSKGYTICAMNEAEDWVPAYWIEPEMKGIQGVIASYFGIDRDKLEDEKSQMLDMLRALNK